MKTTQGGASYRKQPSLFVNSMAVLSENLGPNVAYLPIAMKTYTTPSLVLLVALLMGCPSDSEWTDPSREFGPAVSTEAPKHPVSIHQPTTLGVADSAHVDINGTPIGVACDTCHGPSGELSWAQQPDSPANFHEAVKLEHGTLSCNFCHDDDRTKLHLADGKKLDIGDALVLCSQCHGVQVRDYKAGSHGGMNGYWDLQRGPRDRNHCVDCHAPHTPAYERVMPVHMPQDRFLDESGMNHGRH